MTLFFNPFDVSFVNSLTQSITYVGCHSIFIDDFKVYSDCVFAENLWINTDIAFLRIPCAAMSLFLLSIWCVGCEFSDAVNSIRHVSLSIHWWFQGLQLLSFHRRFMDQQWHSVFYDSMCQPWLYFCYWFDVLFVNSLMLSIPYGSCHSVFIDDFKVYNYSLFDDDLWISTT
jgi:hypothetical protein